MKAASTHAKRRNSVKALATYKSEKIDKEKQRMKELSEKYPCLFPTEKVQYMSYRKSELLAPTVRRELVRRQSENYNHMDEELTCEEDSSPNIATKSEEMDKKTQRRKTLSEKKPKLNPSEKMKYTSKRKSELLPPTVRHELLERQIENYGSVDDELICKENSSPNNICKSKRKTEPKKSLGRTEREKNEGCNKLVEHSDENGVSPQTFTVTVGKKEIKMTVALSYNKKEISSDCSEDHSTLIQDAIRALHERHARNHSGYCSSKRNILTTVPVDVMSTVCTQTDGLCGDVMSTVCTQTDGLCGNVTSTVCTQTNVLCGDVTSTVCTQTDGLCGDVMSTACTQTDVLCGDVMSTAKRNSDIPLAALPCPGSTFSEKDSYVAFGLSNGSLMLKVTRRDTTDVCVFYELSMSVQMQNGVKEWQVHRRYRDFLALHTTLKSLNIIGIKSLPFPRKQLVSWGSNRFLDRRQEALNVYFNEVISIATNSIRSTADTQHSAWSLIAKELDTFLSVDQC